MAEETIIDKIRPYLKVGLGAAVGVSVIYLGIKHYSERVSIKVGDTLNETFGPYMRYVRVEATIMEIYSDVYKRQITTTEIDHWSTRLGRETSESIFRAIIHKPEPFVVQMFLKYAGRMPDSKERVKYQQDWIKFGQKHCGEKLHSQFFMAAMPEETVVALYGLPVKKYRMGYTNFLTDKVEFLDECYNQVYGREAIDSEIKYFKESMRDLPRKVIFDYVSASSVFYTRQLHLMFNPYDPAPDPKKLEFWRRQFRALQDGRSDPNIYRKVFIKYQELECPIQLFEKPFFENRKRSARFMMNPGSSGKMKVPQELLGRIKSIQVPFNMFEHVRFFDSEDNLLLNTSGTSLRDVSPKVVTGSSLADIAKQGLRRNTFGAEIAYFKWKRLVEE